MLLSSQEHGELEGKSVKPYNVRHRDLKAKCFEFKHNMLLRN